MAMSATMALKDITRECQDHMAVYANQILTASQEALASNVMKVGTKFRGFWGVPILFVNRLELRLPYRGMSETSKVALGHFAIFQHRRSF
jgi:hypothetical protein